MTLYTGTTDNGTYSVTVPGVATGLHDYHFVFIDALGGYHVQGFDMGDRVQVLHVDPVDGGPMVARDVNITIDFSEPMQASTLNASTVQIVGSASGPHGGSFQYSGTTLVVNPTADFSPGETVTVTVTRDALSVDGRRIAESCTSTFNVIASAPTPITVGGTLTESTVWTSGNVYLVSSDLTIPSGVTLRIEPGVVAKFVGYRSILVNGTLDLLGTASQQVVFTSYQDDEYGGDTNGDGSASLPDTGDWRSIRYYNTDNVLHDALLRYGGSGSGMVVAEASARGTLEIRDCVIERARGGLYVSAGAPVIQGNTIRETDYPIFQYGATVPIYGGNVLAGNKYDAICVGGTINASTRWEVVQGSIPYLATQWVRVNAGQTLSIDPGVVVKLGAGEVPPNILVYGTLDLRGTASQPVVFTSFQDDEYGGDTNGNGPSWGWRGDWGYIRYENNNNVLHDAILRFGGAETGMVWAAGSTGGTLEIRDCVIEGSPTAGIYASAGALVIEGNTIRQTNWPIYETGPADSIYRGNVLTGNGYNTICVGGTISGSTTWEVIPGSTPYVVVADVTVAAGQTLTIDPGVVVKFGSGKNILVQGTLNSRGTVNEKVVVTSIRDDEYGGDTNRDGSATRPAAGDWGYIQYLNNDNVLRGALLRYGGAINGMVWAAGSTAGTLEIRDSVIEKAQTGIYASAGALVIEGNTIRQTTRPIYECDSANPTYGTNVLSGNTYNGVCVGGTISGSTSWELIPGSVSYLVYADLTVAAQQTLSIDPGVVVKFAPGRNLLVDGTLDLRGTASQRVVFTSDEDDEYGGDTNGYPSVPWAGDWGYIQYRNSSNVLHDALLRCGGAVNGMVWAAGSTAGTLEIRDCVIEKAQTGIYASAGALVIEGNTIRGTNWPIYETGSANPVYGQNVLNENDYLAVCIGGTISGSTTWEVVPGPVSYMVVSSLTVATGATLTIDPEVVVKLWPIGNIVVQGTLDLRATASQRVVFTSFEDDEFGGDTNCDGSASQPYGGDWRVHSVREQQQRDARCDPSVRWSRGSGGRVDGRDACDPGLCDREGSDGNRGFGGAPVIEGNTIRQTDCPIYQTGSSDPIYRGNVLTENTYNAIWVRGTTSGSVTWEVVEGSIPYLVYSDVTVAPGATLTIDPEVVVKLWFTGNILVRGTLDLRGTASQPVVFTSILDDEYGGDTNCDGSASWPYRGSWGSISYLNNSNVLHDAVLRYGGAWDGSVAAVSSTAGTLSIRDCVIENARTGISISDGSPVIERNTIQQSERPIYQTGRGDPIYIGNVLTGNMYQGICVGGTINGAPRWELVEGALSYVVVSPLTVSSAQRLTIDPGVVVKFTPAGNIRVDGTLDLQGTANERVVFTSYRDDEYGGDTNGDGSATLPAAGDWGDIWYYSTNVLHDAIIRYGGKSGYGMVETSAPAITVRHVTFDHFSSTAIKIYSSGAGTTVHNVNFLSTAGYGIYNYTSNLIDARNNYWGSPTGPGGVGPGTGALVSSNVTYSPWLTSPVPDGPTQVVDRRIFYNNSSFDAGGDDLAALAPSPAELAAVGKDPNLGKEALLPGSTATFKNYISYSKGINGIFVDVQGLQSTSLTASDFTFKVGNDDNPSGWANAAAPSIAVGLGPGGSDRITLVWPDNAIPNNNWLQVTLKTGTSGLAAPDVFYFGSAMGETGNNAWSTAPEAKVSSLDAALTRLNNSSFTAVGIENVYDFNRDAVVNSFDAALCRLGNNLLNPLQLIQTPTTAPMATFASAPSTVGSAALAGSTRQEMLYSDLAYSMELARVQKERAPKNNGSMPIAADEVFAQYYRA